MLTSLCKSGRFPQPVFQLPFYFSVLLPEDIDVWTINDTGLHTRTASHKPAELLQWFKSFCVESTTKYQLKGPGVKAELPND